MPSHILCFHTSQTRGNTDGERSNLPTHRFRTKVDQISPRSCGLDINVFAAMALTTLTMWVSLGPCRDNGESHLSPAVRSSGDHCPQSRHVCRKQSVRPPGSFGAPDKGAEPPSGAGAFGASPPPAPPPAPLRPPSGLPPASLPTPRLLESPICRSEFPQAPFRPMPGRLSWRGPPAERGESRDADA